MSHVSGTMAKCLLQYQTWLKAKPNNALILESLLKWYSYYLTGRDRQRLSVGSELAWSAHRLLMLLHHLLLVRTRRSSAAPPPASARLPQLPGARLRATLAVLEYLQLFLELAADRFCGGMGRWTVVFLVQTAKACCRLTLLYGHRLGVLSSCPLQLNEITAYSESSGQSEVIVLPSTGRVVRSLHCARSAESDGWVLPRPVFTASDVQRRLSARHLLAETLHAVTPLCHLVTAALVPARTRSWPAWLLPFLMELTSVQLLRDLNRGYLTVCECEELKSRTVGLLMFSLRSPLYERGVEVPLRRVMLATGRWLPWGDSLMTALTEYISSWRQLHFSLWG